MKITQLVILFNYKKIVLGICVAAVFLIFSNQISSTIFNILFKMVSLIIVLNIIASILASYILYDKSDLYKLNKLKDNLDFEKIDNAIIVHASFDPISKELEERYPNLNITVCYKFIVLLVNPVL